MKSSQRGVQSVEMAGLILRTIVEQSRPLSLKEIADLVETPPSQVYTYLVSLTRVGLLKRNDYTQAFEPGQLSFRLGVSALYRLPKVSEAIPIVNEIGRRLEVNVFVAVWSRHGPIVVHYAEHGTVLSIGFRLGTVLSLTRTATGRLFAAYQPQELSASVIENQTFTRDSLETFQSEEFKEVLDEIRSAGRSVAQGYPTPSVSTISIPVFNDAGCLLLTMTAFSAAASFDLARIAEVTNEMRAASERLINGYAEGKP
ncbi:IclR family transcriptional regulator [Pseudomonas sp. NPDC089395]|uniref:IclR family transcriptional regulator n=1 Tax=unclassified Pseudomonas TaxID=196821 RepID=UPI0030095EC1